MILVVDTNILFSALISPNGNIAKLLTDNSLPVQRVTCHYAIAELFKHQNKIITLSKKPLDAVVDDYSVLLNCLELYNERLIEKHHWQEADRLTSGVDAFDISYVALTLQMDGLLWTGDKKLVAHLHKMGFQRTITTGELFEKLV